LGPDNKFFKDSHVVGSEANVPRFTRANVSVTSAGEKTTEEKKSSKPNPFGDAKPIDTTEILKKKEDEVKSESNTPLLAPKEEKEKEVKEENKEPSSVPAPPPGISKGNKDENREKKNDKRNNNN